LDIRSLHIIYHSHRHRIVAHWIVAINKKKAGHGNVGINIRKSGPGIVEMKGTEALRLLKEIIDISFQMDVPIHHNNITLKIELNP